MNDTELTLRQLEDSLEFLNHRVRAEPLNVGLYSEQMSCREQIERLEKRLDSEKNG